MARTKNATKLAEIEPAADWLTKLKQLEDGKFASDPAAQLVKDWCLIPHAKPKLPERIWQEAKTILQSPRKVHQIINLAESRAACVELRNAVKYLDVEADILNRLTVMVQDALRRHDAVLFRTVADAMEHYKNHTQPIRRRRAALLMLSRGLIETKYRPTLNEICRYLEAKGIEVKDTRAVRFEWKELAPDIPLGREPSARKGKHWRGIQKVGRRLPGNVAVRTFLRVLSEPDE